MGFSATVSNTSDYIAIGMNAVAYSNNSIAIGAGATVATVRVGASVRLSYGFRICTGEVKTVVDGYCYVELDTPIEGEPSKTIMAPIWTVTEIDVLQRFTEATVR